jgi:DHA1 family bicyclomycin/chloramphenicol resistance-like MFS transporter
MSAPPRLPPFWIVIAITVLGPFSLHVVIPAMQPIAAGFGTDSAAAQTTLTAYLIGIAGGQLVYGPLSDRFGRRPIVLLGMSAYLVASFGCALAQSLDSLLALRLLFLRTSRIMRSRSAVLRCEQFRRMTSVPASTSLRMPRSSLHAGPSVATTFVRRAVFTPFILAVRHASFADDAHGNRHIGVEGGT